LADMILENYPVSGLGSITSVAERADVSTPTVARLVQKIGFKGFPEFQEQLRSELADAISGPIDKHDGWAGGAPDTHILNRFTEAVMGNIKQTLAQIDTEVFDQSCRLLADEAATRAARAERAIVAAFGGDCTLPLAAWARQEDGELVVSALLSTPDGRHTARGEGRSGGHDGAAVAAGHCIDALREDGAHEILERIAALQADDS